MVVVDSVLLTAVDDWTTFSRHFARIVYEIPELFYIHYYLLFPFPRVAGVELGSSICRMSMSSFYHHTSAIIQ